MGEGQQGSKRELLAERNESDITSELSIFAAVFFIFRGFISWRCRFAAVPSSVYQSVKFSPSERSFGISGLASEFCQVFAE